MKTSSWEFLHLAFHPRSVVPDPIYNLVWQEHSVTASGDYLIAFLLDTSAGRSARYHLAAVPGLALLAPRWHPVNHQKQDWVHMHRRAGLCVPSWKECATCIALYAFLIIPPLGRELHFIGLCPSWKHWSSSDKARVLASDSHQMGFSLSTQLNNYFFPVAFSSSWPFMSCRLWHTPV